jgi:hypothetical protein
VSTAQATHVRFESLDRADRDRLLRDPEACQVYLDALSLLDDLLCGFHPEPRQPRFPELSTIHEHFQFVLAQSPLPRVAAANVDQNRVAAEGLRREAEQWRAAGERVPTVELAIEEFLDDLAEQYADLARGY